MSSYVVPITKEQEMDVAIFFFQIVNGSGESMENAVKLVVKPPGHVIQSSLPQQGLEVTAHLM